MNAGKNKTKLLLAALLSVVLGWAAGAQSPAALVRSGNHLYNSGDYKGAIDKYERALTEAPAAAEPQFDKANSLYQLDDLSAAAELYRQVGAESKDMKMVTKAKYNLGNCHFDSGARQADSDVQKAIDEMKTAIGCWRSVLDIDPKNEKAARNIEVARLTIKDLLDRQKNQPEPNQPQDANSQNQQGQQNQQQQQPAEPNQMDQQQQQQQQAQSNEPNQADRQQQQAQSGEEPNGPQQQQAQQRQQQEQQEAEAPDATAQQILDREQQQRQQRQMMQRMRYQKVEKDW